MDKPNRNPGNILSALKKRRKLLFVILSVIVVVLILLWGFSPATSGNVDNAMANGQSKPDTIWTCSMHPQIRMPKPGLCPKCNMKLIPVPEQSGDDATGMREFKTSEYAKALMNIETSPVERKFVTADIRMVGKVMYDETKLAYITAWVPGRLDRLYVDYTGVPVKKGDHMVYMYSPELVSAQEELLQAIKSTKEIKAKTKTNSDLLHEITDESVKASREKLRLLGLTPHQIAEIEKRGTASDHITIYSPISGIVIHKNALEGMYVKTGTRIYTVADLSQVWVKLDAYESDLSWLRYGQQVKFSTVSFPGETFTGTISFIDPVLDPVTRTVKVRVDVPNLEGKLKPEMFVKAVVEAEVAAGGKVMDPRLAGKWICPMHPSVIKDQPGKCDICEMPLVRTESLGYASASADESDKPLVIQASAALVTGKRAIVYLEIPDTDKPTYEGREIVLGPRAGDYYIVRNGLKEGDRVVTNGNFKIDSALQIQAKPSMMTPGGGGGSGGHMHMGHAMSGKKSEQMKSMEMVSDISYSQLTDVVAAADVVEDAIGKLQLPQIKLAFFELGKTVKQVNPNLLEGKFHRLWVEISMLLNNDVFEGSHAKTLKDAKRASESLKTHIAEMKSKFGLIQMKPKPVKIVASPKFYNQLCKVFDSYFDMQQALAKDDFENAKAAALKIQKSLNDVDMKLLSGESHMLWMKHFKSLEKIISEMTADKNIDKLRENFALLSEEMSAVGKNFGVPGKSAAYQLKCPMAFNNRGATWLQRDKDTRNPYFGSAMLKCGEVIDTIKPAEDTGGHQHD